MTSKNINVEILRFAIPNILSNISVPLMSSVDTGLMGQLSTGHLAAVGIAAMIFNMFFWIFGFLRMGTTGMTAQSYGASQHEEVCNSLWRGIAIAIVLGLALLLMQVYVLQLGLWSMAVDVSYAEYVKQYFEVRICEAPGYLILICMMGWFFGMQNARVPLVITIILNLVNIGVSYYLVSQAQMGIRGVAMGTVIATYMGVFLSILVLGTRYRSYFKRLDWVAIFDWKHLARFLRINGDLFKRTVCLMLTFVLLYRYAAQAGDVTLAVTVVMLQFINWMSYGIDGYAHAAESIVGKYKGGNDTDTLSHVIRMCMMWGGAVAVLYSIIYGLYGDVLVHLFTKDPEVIRIFDKMQLWIVVVPIIGFASYIWDGVFVGLLASRSMWYSMVIAFVLYALLLWSLPELPYANNLWIAFAVFLLARGLGQTYLYIRNGLELK